MTPATTQFRQITKQLVFVAFAAYGAFDVEPSTSACRSVAIDHPFDQSSFEHASQRQVVGVSQTPKLKLALPDRLPPRLSASESLAQAEA